MVGKTGDAHGKRLSKESVRKRKRKVAQWDIAYVPNDSAFRRCRVLIRETAPKEFRVYAIGYEGSKRLTS